MTEGHRTKNGEEQGHARATGVVLRGSGENFLAIHCVERGRKKEMQAEEREGDCRGRT